MLLGFVRASHGLEHDPERVVGIRVLGSQFQCEFEFGKCAVAIAAGREREAEIVVRPGIIRAANADPEIRRRAQVNRDPVERLASIHKANRASVKARRQLRAWRERHDGEDLIVVRKGATPAFPGQKGFIGGSMGDDAVIVEGTIAPGTATERKQRDAMYSTVHGAGRVMSRTHAAGKRNRRTGKILSRGAVSPEMMRAWVREKNVILRGGGLDESPHVYRRLPDVLAAQRGTIDILHTLRPLIVVMAGADMYDPYRD